MREVLLLASVGAVAGLAISFGAARLVETQLFGIRPVDAATMFVAAAGIAAAAGVAGYLPARRATGINPMRALRWE